MLIYVSYWMHRKSQIGAWQHYIRAKSSSALARNSLLGLALTAVFLAGAIERQHRKLLKRTGAEPLLLMTGGAAVKLAPITDLRFETVDSLIFDGLLEIQSRRLAL